MQFYLVYIREAHPSDGWHPDKTIVVKDPTTDTERAEVAGTCVANLNLPFPAVLDKMDNKVGLDYDAWPDRFFLIDPAGVIAWHSAPGPAGFKPDLLRQAIFDLLAAPAPAEPTPPTR